MMPLHRQSTLIKENKTTHTHTHKPNRRFVDYDRITHRRRRSSLLYRPAMYYGWTYPSLLLVLTICLTYDVIMPVTLLLGVIYFLLVEILYTCVPVFVRGLKMGWDTGCVCVCVCVCLGNWRRWVRAWIVGSNG
jgi:hypothetical protein